MALYDWRELVVIVAKREGKTPQEIAVIIGVVL
jgi:DNA-binding CsgD family transcriptional regulator